MDAADTWQCPGCGSKLPEDLPHGLCPRCVLDETVSLPRLPELDEEWDFGEAGPLPRTFGNYTLLERISHGGMGVVYKARQVNMHRFVALKMLLMGPHSAPELVRRFRVEAVAAGSLSHPNIVPVHEVGTHEGMQFIAMDFVDGPTFSSLVQERPLPALRAAQYLVKIADAIHYAHKRKVLHRDIKGSNVLLGEDDEPRVTDFGLAKRYGDGDSATVFGGTEDGQILGSASTMSPEQATGRQSLVGPRSDIYSLGALLYHLVTGRVPFSGESLGHTLRMVETQEPIAPRLLNSAVPLDIETICLKCLEKDPEKRYETAEELKEELQRFLRGEPIHARPIGTIEKVWRWCQRKPELSASIAAAVGLFVTGFAISLWQWHRAEDKAYDAQLRLYIADMNLAQEALLSQNRWAALNILEKYVPRGSGARDFRGWEWRYLWSFCQSDQFFSIQGQEPVQSIAISPDSRWVATAARDGKIVIRDYASKGIAARFEQGEQNANQKYWNRQVAFSPDGQTFAAIINNQVRIAKSGTPAFLTQGHGTQSLSSVLFDPSGLTILTTGSAGLQAWDAKTGEPRDPPVNFTNRCSHIALSKDRKWLALGLDGVGGVRGGIQVWDLATGWWLFEPSRDFEGAATISLSENGLLAVFDRHGGAQVWDLAATLLEGVPNILKSWPAHPSTVYSAAFSADGSFLATGGNQTIQIWSTLTWSNIRTLKGHSSEVWSLAYGHDGNELFTGGKDGVLGVWNLRTQKPPDELSGSFYPLWISANNSNLVTTAQRSRQLQCWNVATRELEHTHRVLTNRSVTFFEIAPDGERLAAPSGQTIYVVAAGSFDVIGTLAIDTKGLVSVRPRMWLADSRRLLIRTERDINEQRQHNLELFDGHTFQHLRTFPAVTDPSDVSQDQRLLAACTKEGVVHVVDVLAGKLVARFQGGGKSVRLSNDGKLLAIAKPDDSLIRIWDIRREKLLCTLAGHQEDIGRMCFSRDSRTLFTTSTDDTVRMWNVETGQEMVSVKMPGDTWELLLSRDDTLLAVGGTGPSERPVTLLHAPAIADIERAMR